MGLVRVLVVTTLIMAAAWAAFVFLPREIRIPAIFLLVGLLQFYGSDSFRNWRLRRKLERISRSSIDERERERVKEEGMRDED